VAAHAADNWPKLFQCLRAYDAQTFVHDLIAGVTVGLVALPLAMAFAISSVSHPRPASTARSSQDF
jgi:SulP family sulfate permease